MFVEQAMELHTAVSIVFERLRDMLYVDTEKILKLILNFLCMILWFDGEKKKKAWESKSGKCRQLATWGLQASILLFWLGQESTPLLFLS